MSRAVIALVTGLLLGCRASLAGSAALRAADLPLGRRPGHRRRHRAGRRRLADRLRWARTTSRSTWTAAAGAWCLHSLFRRPLVIRAPIRLPAAHFSSNEEGDPGRLVVVAVDEAHIRRLEGRPALARRRTVHRRAGAVGSHRRDRSGPPRLDRVHPRPPGDSPPAGDADGRGRPGLHAVQPRAQRGAGDCRGQPHPSGRRRAPRMRPRAHGVRQPGARRRRCRRWPRRLSRTGGAGIAGARPAGPHPGADLRSARSKRWSPASRTSPARRPSCCCRRG